MELRSSPKLKVRMRRHRHVRWSGRIVIIVCAVLSFSKVLQSLRAEGASLMGCDYSSTRNATTNDVEFFKRQVSALRSTRITVREITGYVANSPSTGRLDRHGMPQLPVPPTPTFRMYPVTSDVGAKMITALGRARPQAENDRIGLCRPLLLSLGDDLPLDKQLVLEARGNVVIVMAFQLGSPGNDRISLVASGLDKILQGIIREGISHEEVSSRLESGTNRPSLREMVYDQPIEWKEDLLADKGEMSAVQNAPALNWICEMARTFLLLR